MKGTAVKKSICFFLVLSLQVLCTSVSAREQTELVSLYELPIEALMDIEVVSVTRSEGQDVFTSPAAVYVVTREDIRRSGHTSLPEQLRMVPGLHVARIDGSSWAITSRGRNSRFARNMLVQQDGRTIYSPIFPGCTGKCRTPCWKTWTASRWCAGPAAVCGGPMRFRGSLIFSPRRPGIPRAGS